MTPLLTPDQAHEIAKDHAPEIVADVETHTELTGIAWTSLREHVEDELTHLLENLHRPDREQA